MTRKKVTRLPLRRRFLIGCKQLGEHGGTFHGSLLLDFSPQQWAGLLFEHERVRGVLDDRTSVLIENDPNGRLTWLPWPCPTDKPYIELHRDADSPIGPDININWSLTIDVDGASWNGQSDDNPVIYLSEVFPLSSVEP